MKKWLGCLMALAWIIPASSEAATVSVSFQPLNSTVNVGDNFSVGIMANISDPILGWGLDVSFDPTILSLSGTPTIGSLWLGAFAPDGDGLAALAFPTGVSGNNVLLATLTFHAINFGTSGLAASVTPGDLTEGFALVAPGAFADLTFTAGSVSAVPLPAAVLLFGSGLLGLVGIARRSRRA